MLFTPRRLLTAGLTLACALVFGAALSSSTSEKVLRASFATALDHAPAHSVAVASADTPAPVSGSEDYWLNDESRNASVEAKKAVSVGDTISLDLGGERRTLQVSKISEYTPHMTEIDTTTHPSHFVMITARDNADPASRPIRLVMEIEQANASVSSLHSGRSL